MRMIVAVIPSFLAFAQPALAGPTIQTMCQKNLADGRILIQDYHVLPNDDSTFEVTRYRATKSDESWSEGPCTIVVTGRAR